MVPSTMPCTIAEEKGIVTFLEPGWSSHPPAWMNWPEQSGAEQSAAEQSAAGRTLIPHFFDVPQGRTQPGQPGIRVLSGQPHAPRQRVAATARHARVNERVKNPALGLAQPGHHRNRECGEHLSHVRT